MQSETELGAIIYESPRPRMLIRGFVEEPDLVRRLSELCPTVKHVSALNEVRQAEWDILVTDSPISRHGQGWSELADLHLGVVYRPSKMEHWTQVERRHDWNAQITSGTGIISQEIRRVKGLPGRIAELSHEQLEPLLRSRESHQHYFIHGQGTESSPQIQPFIATPDGHILAGRYRRSEDSEGWLIPADAPDLDLWVKAALGEWHSLNPDRFPGLPDWAQSPHWMTQRELTISDDIENVRKRRAEILEELDEKEMELRARLSEARNEADSYERALLTAQSDDLKSAVQKVLLELGFRVLDSDATAPPDDHLEDLQIGDPDSPDWVCLGEVKGYSKGAKTEALTQFLRFNSRYMTSHGKVPDACWYIVNQFMNRDPSRRQLVLNGKDDDVEAFGSAGGLVLDTVELFKLLGAVRRGDLQAAQAREALRSGTGRFRTP
ncbi:hypothetical protein [Streptomyces virginiae]|uniref:hypothetical protein n=1 Tax=Streptomyces virginiae TaxID=1961 RepID=UPI0036F18B6B